MAKRYWMFKPAGDVYVVGIATVGSRETSIDATRTFPITLAGFTAASDFVEGKNIDIARGLGLCS